MFAERLWATGMQVDAVVKSDRLLEAERHFGENNVNNGSLKDILSKSPDIIVVSTPNPVEEVLQQVRDNLSSRTTVVLPQNGIAVVEVAKDILKDSNVSLVRASLFTPVSNVNGNVDYDAQKLRIGLSAVPGFRQNPNLDQDFLKTGDLFRESGFDVRLFGDYRSMEWTKLVLNGVGSTSAITGFTPLETFTDPELYVVETKALKQRLRLLKEEGIPLADIPWSGAPLLPLFDHLPMVIKKSGMVKGLYTGRIVKGRGNKPSASARKITEGKPTELEFYHQPFIDLGVKHQLPSSVDSAIMQIVKSQAKGEIDISTLSPVERKMLLIDALNKNE